MSSKLQMNRLRKFTISLVGRFLVVFILGSFAVALLPLATSASSMSCCIGKAAGHCDSGLKAHKPAPPPDDPMCGLKAQPLTPESLDAVTVTAETVDHPDSHEHKGNAFKTPSVQQHCQMECGACATATSRLKREKTVVQAKTSYAPLVTIIARVENQAPISSSNQKWTRISPRGPPARG